MILKLMPGKRKIGKCYGAAVVQFLMNEESPGGSTKVILLKFIFVFP